MPIQPPDVVTTQRTAKRFKAIMLAGGAGLILAASVSLWAVMGVESDTVAAKLVLVAAVMAAASVGLYALGSGLAWWYHE